MIHGAGQCISKCRSYTPPHTKETNNYTEPHDWELLSNFSNARTKGRTTPHRTEQRHDASGTEAMIGSGPACETNH